MPLPASGISTEAFVAIWEQLLPAVARAAEPDFLVVSAGFDYVAGDPVGDLGVGVEAASGAGGGHRPVGRRVLRGRVIYVLEGGYDIDALTGSIASIAQESDAGSRLPERRCADLPSLSRFVSLSTKYLGNSQEPLRGVRISAC